MAEWLCSGLQIRGPRFDSGFSLHIVIVATIVAGIAQLVEHDLAKVGVASSNLVSRSNTPVSPGGEIGRRKGLKIPR